jgi:hypothetical protein
MGEAYGVERFAAVVGFSDKPGAPHHFNLVGLVPVVPVLVSLGRDPALQGKLPDARDAPAKQFGCLPSVDMARWRQRLMRPLSRWHVPSRGERLDLEQVDRAT